MFSLNKRELTDLDVKSLFVFGSVARGEAKPTSDIDILVSFHGTSTFDIYRTISLRKILPR